MFTTISGPGVGTSGRSVIKVKSTDATGLTRRVNEIAKSRQSFGYRAKKKFVEKAIARTVFSSGLSGRTLSRPQAEKRAALLASKLPGMRGGVLDLEL